MTGVNDHWKYDGKRRDESILLAFRSLPTMICPLDLCKEFRLTDFELSCDQVELENTSRIFTSSSCHTSSEYQSEYMKMYKIFSLKKDVEAIENTLSDDQLSLFPEFLKRMKVLRELKYVDVDPFGITLKGRVACEINTCDELLVTEIIFSDILEQLNPPECVGILSALVCQEKSTNVPTLTRYIFNTMK